MGIHEATKALIQNQQTLTFIDFKGRWLGIDIMILIHAASFRKRYYMSNTINPCRSRLCSRIIYIADRVSMFKNCSTTPVFCIDGAHHPSSC